MTFVAIVFLVVAFVITGGGLIASIIFLARFSEVSGDLPEGDGVEKEYASPGSAT